jgi:hypothetical protein
MMDGLSLLRGESGNIAITVTSKTSHVIAFVLGVGKHLGFWESEL